jgi:putative ABC transport system permease protein
MSVTGFIVRNALRNKRRALLSILSVAVSLFLLVTLLVGLRELTVPMEDIGAASRIIVRNKISLGNLLPARQKQVIERIPGVEIVTPFTWFGGKFRGEEVMIGQFAMDPEAVLVMLTDAKVPKEQYEAFKADRRACLLGKNTAEKYKLKLGDKIQLQGTFWPYDLDLHLAGIYEGTIDDRNLFFHHKYLEEHMRDGGGLVGTWWLKTKTLEDIPNVVAAINKAFENTSAEVRAETERTFQLSFISMWGNIKMLVGVICSVVVFTLLLVTVSTMSMAVRERFRELAILKAIGYRRRELFTFILAESFGLAAFGALLGVGGAYLLFNVVQIMKKLSDMFVSFEVTPRIIGQACLVAATLGIISCIAPSWSAARMSVVQGLKTLD